LIEAIETGERALIPYRWEQIGSKHLTSSRMQRRSPRTALSTGTDRAARVISPGSRSCRTSAAATTNSLDATLAASRYRVRRACPTDPILGSPRRERAHQTRQSDSAVRDTEASSAGEPQRLRASLCTTAARAHRCEPRSHRHIRTSRSSSPSLSSIRLHQVVAAPVARRPWRGRTHAKTESRPGLTPT